MIRSKASTTTARPNRLVAFDVGGTFTDVIVLETNGTLQTTKIPSVLSTVGADMVKAVSLSANEKPNFVHGTTVATNALLEQSLAKVGLITTLGFRDVLEMRSQRRPNIYDINWERSACIIPRSLRIEVRERILADGSVDVAINRDDVVEAVKVLAEAGVEAIAICLINSYANPVHEKLIADYVRSTYPKLPLSVSSEGFAEMREYERTSTTSVNAALMPIVDSYLRQLQAQLRVEDASLLVMQSNGGVMDAGQVRVRPVQIIESGPAAGVLAAAHLARTLELKDVLSFDMGGTTAKASMIRDGLPLERPGSEVGGTANVALRFFGGQGHAIRVASLDISEVGAGGGSIAWIDPGGALKVGPKSAGASPGPACYEHGGSDATVTDANVVLGYLNPHGIAGTTFFVNRDVALKAIEDRVAGPLKLSPVEAAYGIVRVANATMIRALRAASTDRGIDPRGAVLIAFGGSGPLHAASLAEILGVKKVVVPPLSGIFSSVGLLLADYRHDAVRTLVMPLKSLDVARLDGEFCMIERELKEMMRAEGISHNGIRTMREVDIKYRGQDTAVNVPAPAFASDFAIRLEQDFVAAYRAAYGHARSTPAEVVGLRVRATAPAGIADLALVAVHAHERVLVAPTVREAYFGPQTGWRSIAVTSRQRLVESAVRGPLIIEEWDTSIVVPPGWTASLLADHNVVVLDQVEGGGK